MSVKAGESFRFEQEVVFDGHLFGSESGYSLPGQAQVIRGSDGFYWNDVLPGFQAIEVWNDTVTQVTFHYYDWTVPLGAADGDSFVLRVRLRDDPATETVGNLVVREVFTDGGTGGSSGSRVFDAVDFATGFPSTFAA